MRRRERGNELKKGRGVPDLRERERSPDLSDNSGFELICWDQHRALTPLSSAELHCDERDVDSFRYRCARCAPSKCTKRRHHSHSMCDAQDPAQITERRELRDCSVVRLPTTHGTSLRSPAAVLFCSAHSVVFVS